MAQARRCGAGARHRRASARALMLTQPSVIKRPVVEWGDGRIRVGFDAAQWSEDCRHHSLARRRGVVLRAAPAVSRLSPPACTGVLGCLRAGGAEAARRLGTRGRRADRRRGAAADRRRRRDPAGGADRTSSLEPCAQRTLCHVAPLDREPAGRARSRHATAADVAGRVQAGDARRRCRDGDDPGARRVRHHGRRARLVRRRQPAGVDGARRRDVEPSPRRLAWTGRRALGHADRAPAGGSAGVLPQRHPLDSPSHR